MIPEKVYVYIESDDTICCLNLTYKKTDTVFLITKKVWDTIWIVTYEFPLYKTTLDMDNKEEEWDDGYCIDGDGFLLFRKKEDAYLYREKITTEKYNLYLNKLNSQPKYEE